MLDKKLLKDIVKGIERTSTIEIACAIVGISEAAFYKWQAKGRELLEDLENGEEIDKQDEIYVEFVESVERARYISCLPAIDTIQKAIKNGDAKASEKFLARRMPTQFGDYGRKEITIKTEEKDASTGVVVIPTFTSGDNDLDDILRAQQAKSMENARERMKEFE